MFTGSFKQRYSIPEILPWLLFIYLTETIMRNSCPTKNALYPYLLEFVKNRYIKTLRNLVPLLNGYI